ncbi:hypothetical protein [Limosilactobacillus difficilis]|uniref:hypothetical protein n=1 Tax=Limosilactobacillus difficilis TaxID=2991838 RepID=UPI0024B94EC0|nr:hypothetical protein [Limosilactobacillus difficilis]
MAVAGVSQTAMAADANPAANVTTVQTQQPATSQQPGSQPAARTQQATSAS